MSANSILLRRTIHPETKVLDAAAGLVEYVASDESIDSYREVIRADGWRFSRFTRNAPFVDSHNYDTVENLLGKVVDYRVDGRRLVETVQWAIDVPENKLAQLGFRLTQAGYLKAVSVGFVPLKSVSRWDQNGADWQAQLAELKLTDESGVRTIYTEQEQVELSAVVIGANPNALARAWKDGVMTPDDEALLSQRMAAAETTAREAHGPGPVSRALDPAARLAIALKLRNLTLKRQHERQV